MKENIISKEQLIECICKNPIKADTQRELKISQYELNKLLQKYNLTYNSSYNIKGKSKYDFIDECWLNKYWIHSSKSLRDLSLEFNIPLQALEQQSIKLNIHKPYKFDIKTDRLFDLNNPHLWYLAGLTVTDGYLAKNLNSIEIDLTGDSEKLLLSQIQEYFGGQLKAYGVSHRLRIATADLNSFFETNFNIKSGSKTYTAKTPTIICNEDCAKAYVRGCFDGDGYIGKTGNNWSFVTASPDLVFGLQAIILQYTGINIPKNYVNVNGISYPRLGATDRKAREVLCWIYSLDNCFRLERKYQNYLRYYEN